MSSESPAVVIFSIDGYEAEITNYNPAGTEHALIVRNIPSGTQNITGTITANIGTTNGLALNSTLTSGTAKVQIYDGVDILGTSAHPVKTDPTGTTSQPITGTITANAGSGTFNIAASSLPLPSNAATETTLASALTTSVFTGRINTQGQKTMATSTPVVLASDQTTIPISDNGGSITIDGTITANIGTVGTLALNSSLINGSQTTNITDGTNTAAVKPASIPAATTDPALVVAISPNNTVPVSGTFWQATQPVSAAALPLPSGASTETTLALIKAKTDNLDVALSTRAITGLTDTQLRATPVPVSGTITANAGSGTFTVSGTVTSNIGTTNGLALDATLTGGTQTTRITDGTNTASVKAASTAAVVADKAVVVAISPNNTVAVTGTFFQGTQPVSGTITANAGSGTMAVSNTVLSVVGGGTEATAQRVTLANDSTGVLSVDDNGSSLTVDGTVTANAGSGTFAVSAAALPLPTGAATETTLGTRLADSTFTGRINTQGQKTMAASTPVVIASDQSAITVTGTVSATNPSVATVAGTPPASATYIGGSVTTGAPTYTTGQINPLSLTTAGALRVDNSAITQPVSGTITANAGTGNFTVVQSVAANLNATVSGTITANIGTSGSIALDATLTGGTQRNRITDGTTNVAVKAASTAAIASDPALVVAISPNNTIAVSGTVTANNPSVSATGSSPPASATYLGGSVTTAAPTYTTGQMSALSLTTAGSLRIDGSAATQPVSGTISATQSGTWTIQPGNTANTTPWLTTISQGGNAATVSGAGALKVDGSAATQPVSGTFWQTTQPVSGTTTSNQGTANTAANGWFTRLTDGTTNVAVKAASTLADFTDPALVVSLNPASAQTRAANASVASVASSATSVTLLAANSNRLGAIIVNDSTQILFIKFGSSASSSSFTAAVPISRGTYEVPFGYTGIITGVWVSANGNARTTEITI